VIAGDRREDRRLSSESNDESLQIMDVGCCEWHALRPERHAASFDHNGCRINVVGVGADDGAGDRAEATMDPAPGVGAMLRRT
jgi:hypothetical protein